MIPDFGNEHFLAQMKQLKPKGTFNSYLVSLTAMMHGYDVIFYKSQKEASSKISTFPATFPDPVFFDVKSGNNTVKFASSRTEFEEPKASQLTLNKSYLKAYLAKAGINVPFGGGASVKDLAILDKMKRAGVDLVSVKPVAGKGSRGVRLNKTLEQAETIVKDNPDDVFIIEQMIVGAEFRVTASKTDVVAAQMIIPPHVIGDGKSTLNDLITQETEARKRNPVFAVRPLDPRQIIHMVSVQKAHGSNVLDKGKVFRLTADGLPNVAFRVPVLDRLPQQIKDIATQTVQLIRGSVCGLDIFADRAGIPYVLDIDATSGMWFESFPHPKGDWNLDVPEYILRKNFPRHRSEPRQILSYDYAALKDELLREDRQTKGVNAADFVEFA